MKESKGRDGEGKNNCCWRMSAEEGGRDKEDGEKEILKGQTRRGERGSERP